MVLILHTASFEQKDWQKNAQHLKLNALELHKLKVLSLIYGLCAKLLCELRNDRRTGIEKRQLTVFVDNIEMLHTKKRKQSRFALEQGQHFSLSIDFFHCHLDGEVNS